MEQRKTTKYTTQNPTWPRPVTCPVMSQDHLFRTLDTGKVRTADESLESLFPKRQILESSKMNEFADDNFKFDKNGRKFSKCVENTVGKAEIARSQGVFKRLELQTHKTKGLFGKGLTLTVSLAEKTSAFAYNKD